MSECTCGWTKGMRSVCICPKDKSVATATTYGQEAASGPPLITMTEPPGEPVVVSQRLADARREYGGLGLKAKAKVAKAKPPTPAKKAATRTPRQAKKK